MSNPPDFDQVWREFDEIATHLGFSLDNPKDGIKLAFWIFASMRHLIRQPRVPAAKKARGRKATEAEKDAIVLAIVEVAKRQGDSRPVSDIIRELATHNGWRADDAAIKTLRGRYYNVRRVGSRAHRNMVAALQPLLPELERRAKQLDELERAGLSPAEIEVVMDRLDVARNARARP
jgi:hypothetical protein